MKIKTVKIRNWRSIKEIEIIFQDLMMFIGQNNHGKSNILSALLFFFGELKHNESDFFNDANELSVEIEFYSLDANDKRTFAKYLTSGETIRVIKIAQYDGSFKYTGYAEIPEDERLQESNAPSYTTRETANTLPFANLLPTTGRLTKQDIIKAQLQYINQHRSSLTFTYEMESSNFMGLTSVAKTIFGQVIFIPAIRNISDDLSIAKTSPFGVLFTKILESVASDHAKWSAAENSLKLLFDSLNKFSSDGNENPERPHSLISLESQLSDELNAWGCSVDLEIPKPEITDMIKGNINFWVNDGTRTLINKKGHGMQRAVTFALMKTIHKILNHNSNTEQTGRQASNSLYYILEEPELYLHPQAQKMLLDSLQTISNANQVIICTHSSHLINLETYKSICIVRKIHADVGTRIFQYINDIFSGNDKDDFHLSYWVNPDRGELFFAKKVLLVEGETDKTIIPYTAKLLDVFKYEYTIIDCGSKDNIPLYIKLLNKFLIPYIAIYDKDHQSGKGADAINSADISTNRIENEIDPQIGSSIVFENDIEEEIGYSAGRKSKGFEALKFISNGTFSMPYKLKGKIEKIYS
ncbi:MAG: ATP-dependent endonuclease [Burkholderiales bacterium]|nr:ATP-dependent endonuclease [Burkholderiales bacterium]